MTATRDLSLGAWLFPDAAAPSLIETIVDAERRGFDEVWLGDEGPGGRDPFLVLAGAATRTTRVELGVAVTNPYLRHPATTAAASVTLHEVSGGRFTLGLGAGGTLALGPIHVRRDEPIRRVATAIGVIRAVTGARGSEAYSPPPLAASAPVPLYLGGRGERINRLASSSADGAFLGGIPFSQLDRTLSWVRSVRPVEVALYVNAVFDRRELDTIRPRLLHPFLDAPESTQLGAGLDPAALAEAARQLDEGDDAAARALMTDDRLDDLVLVGSPRRVGDRLAQLISRHGARRAGLSFLTASPDHHLAEAEAAFAATRERLCA